MASKRVLENALRTALGWWMSRAAFVPPGAAERRDFRRCQALVPDEDLTVSDRSGSVSTRPGEEGEGGVGGDEVAGVRVSERSDRDSSQQQPERAARGRGRAARQDTEARASDDAPPWEVPVSAPRAGKEWQSLVDYLTDLYANANAGAKPTWTGRAFSQLKNLVRVHGVDEVRKRATNMWTAPPKWPPPPYDVNTLAAHFDRFAVPFAGDKRAHDDVQRRAGNYYGEQGEVDMIELRRRIAAAAARGEKYTGPQPMKQRRPK